MKKTIFVVLLIGLLTASIPLQGHHRFEFIDVSSEYSVYTGVEFVRTRNLMLGYNDGTFRPFQNITRAELVSVLVKAAGFKPDPNVFQNCFEDVLQQWFANEVCFAKAQGWMNVAQAFYGAGEPASGNEAIKLLQNIFGFTPNFASTYVTRGEAAQTLFNVLGSGLAAGYSAKVATASTVVSPTYYNNSPTVMMNLEWGRLTGFNQTTVDFSGYGSLDPDGDPVTFVWNMGDGTKYFTLDPPAHTFRNLGEYTVTFTVIDSRGASSKAIQKVNVVLNPGVPLPVLPPAPLLPPPAGYSVQYPTVSAGLTYANNPPTVFMNLQSGSLAAYNMTTVDFNGFGTRDPDGDNLAYVWDMGDGTRYFMLDPPAHTYRQFGNFLVTFRVIDSRGASAKVEQLVNVLRMPPAVTQVSYALPVTPAGYHYVAASYTAPRFTRNVPAGYPAPWVP